MPYNLSIMTLLESILLATGWIVWMIPFFLAKRRKQPAQKIDHRARWGILLAGLGFAWVWQGNIWQRATPPWRIAPAVLFFALAAVFSWTATRALGRQWRVDAGLSSDHELITAGPYRIVRHPIYTSMLCMLLATGLVKATWLQLAGALTLVMAGTEIRVRVEEQLLASRFGDKFARYKNAVPAYVPSFRVLRNRG